MMERLTGMDAAFLALETDTMHMHVGAVMVFDPSSPETGEDVPTRYFDRLRAVVEERIHLVPPLRRRVVRVPFGIHHPMWVEDPDFELDYHLRRASLPAPGGPTELAAFVADLAGRPLDQNSPLWEIHVVEGLESGHIAVVPKVHHSLFDGASGVEVVASFLDTGPVPRVVPFPGRPWRPEPIPTEAELIALAMSSLVRQPERAAGALRRLLAERGERLEESVVAMVPMSRRADADRGTLGNKVSAMLVALATQIADPVERYTTITAGTRLAKDQARVLSEELIQGWAQLAFPALSSRIARMAGNLRLFDHLPPLFNVLVSNIAGPDFALWCAGARLVALYPIGPIIEGVGLNVTVASYEGTLYFGILGCRELVPEVMHFGDLVTDAFAELLKAAERNGGHW